MGRLAIVLSALGALLPSSLPAQDAAAPAPLSVPEAALTLPAFTMVEIEILTPLNSKTSRMGEMFPIRLAEPIIIDGTILVPAGATGEGEIIHAAKARAAGKAGEMILAARYIEHRGIRIALRSFKFGPATGKSNVQEASASASRSPRL
ncbi:MAG: hypothetical protein HC788_01425 [Sphingopyxis sp.]|nr:hypothetical protein [Sphingopyxis sp.]